VAVLQGGDSPEREVSLSSGAAVLEALQCASRSERGPGQVEAVEIARDGRWLARGGTHGAVECLTLLADVDVWFLALHGGRGENGTLQGFLEQAGCRYTGSGPQASALCMDKLAARASASALGLEVAAGLCVGHTDWAKDAAALCSRAEALSKSGWVVKPRRGGSSVATFVCQAAGELAPCIEEVLATGDEALIEERIPGVELSCAVLGSGARAQALPPIEIRPRSSSFFDYREKYSAGGAQECCPPRSLDERACSAVQQRALLLHQRLGCRGHSRSDFIVRPRPAAGQAVPVFLELNTLPGLTPRSLLPQEARAAGLDFESLCLRLIADALEWGAGPAEEAAWAR
jgi:D-alanine-D-alanine ligase